MIKLFKVKEKQREQAENASGGPPVKKQSAGELRLHKANGANLTKWDKAFVVITDLVLRLLKAVVSAILFYYTSSRLHWCALPADISELNLPTSCIIRFPNGKDDLMNFEVSIQPDDGYYMYGTSQTICPSVLCLIWRILDVPISLDLHPRSPSHKGGTFLFTFQVSPIYPHEAPKVKCKTKVYHPNIDLEGNVCLNILREDWKPVLNINTVIYGLYHLFTEPNYEDPLNHEAAAVLRENPKLFESNVRRAMAGGYVGQTYFTRCM
ncbi:hypothetical protein V8G54_002284 [Vigna mungo]|uniref:UBC core domain-containing protein n=1 Tax=Vigna mungo TaxID=3915 RepID=A0AAQ3P9W5_VIGMU